MEHWYALHAKPQRERLVAEHLRARGLKVYLPLGKVHPVNPRAAKERPFFPCYLFAQMELERLGMQALEWTPGLRRLVQFGDQPAIVPDQFVAELARRLARIRAAGRLVFDGLQVGDRVEIVRGPFAGYEALFDARLSGSERVRVMLEFIRESQGRRQWLSRRIPVELNAGDIRKIRK